MSRSGTGGPVDVTADHQDDPHHHDQASFDPTGVGGQGEHDGRGVGGGVYARAYAMYDERGWTNSLKLPRARKAPPPGGFTGKEGRHPSAEQKAQWAQQEPDGNIAQRMPECVVCEREWVVIGIDVDNYGAKRGGLTLQPKPKSVGAYCRRPIPARAATDGISKIRLYRIPKGVKLAGVITFPELGLGDVEIIQPHHRYLVCWPSIHPDTGNLYRWYDLHDGVMDGPPPVWEIPELPEAWLQALKVENKTKGKTKARITDDTAWVECPYIIEQCLTEGEMSAKVARRLGDATAHCYGGTRHDHILKDSLALLRDSIRNHTARHFPVQHVARATYREILERRARENAVDFVEGVGTAITPMALYETIMVKGYETVVDPDIKVDVNTAMIAAGRLQSLLDTRSGQPDIVDIMVKQNRIIAAIRSTVPESLWPQLVRRLEGMAEPAESLDHQIEDTDDEGFDPMKFADDDDDL